MENKYCKVMGRIVELFYTQVYGGTESIIVEVDFNMDEVCRVIQGKIGNFII